MYSSRKACRPADYCVNSEHPHAGRLEGASDRPEFGAIKLKTAPNCNPLQICDLQKCHLEEPTLAWTPFCRFGLLVAVTDRSQRRVELSLYALRCRLIVAVRAAPWRLEADVSLQFG